MAEPLTVDTSRLHAAGETLQGVVFPSFPAPVTAAGTDAMSAAINATMPIIEAPVADGLPAAKAALDQTAAKMASAATIYSDADHTLGRQLGTQEFATAQPGARASALRTASTEPEQVAATDEASAAAFSGAEIASQMTQFVAAAAMVTSGAQTISQSVQGVVGSFSGSAMPPATEDEADEQQATGATAGEQALEGVPVQSATGPSPAGSDRGGQRAVQ
ncbi:hypothetical protein [Mycolicibacterium sphagni]|uniref:PE domain-containing protein n=1 Tax=Mycolicibacterium sphagni TaxID=1786 RepID=A0ABX2JSY8_9MYCO|nr:hypothetical protein [Mycolicibacterium sphagni]NTY60701.1 hypothetical protein [Mycolicibacterium sphagni]